MSIKRQWRTSDKWRTVAYGYFRNSSDWRNVIELNPEYDIRWEPAAGVEINITAPSGAETTANKGVATAGILQTTDVVLDLRGPTTTSLPPSLEEGIFPWDTFEQFSDRLSEYTATALFDRDRTNGFGLDSPQAIEDTQRG